MKRYTMLALIAAFALAACGGDKPATDTADTPAAAETTVTIRNHRSPFSSRQGAGSYFRASQRSSIHRAARSMWTEGARPRFPFNAGLVRRPSAAFRPDERRVD